MLQKFIAQVFDLNIESIYAQPEIMQVFLHRVPVRLQLENLAKKLFGIVKIIGLHAHGTKIIEQTRIIWRQAGCRSKNVFSIFKKTHIEQNITEIVEYLAVFRVEMSGVLQCLFSFAEQTKAALGVSQEEKERA
ncbi:MAG: hypothetical protein ACD_39C01008G0001 [uncultured bacterium]|nr:MAG: hypothetical protein ACD_39C01008G0001 [uncultured bacterium]